MARSRKVTNFRKMYKWTSAYFRMLVLAQKRGISWARKHKKRFAWLNDKLNEMDVNKILITIGEKNRNRRKG